MGTESTIKKFFQVAPMSKVRTSMSVYARVTIVSRGRGISADTIDPLIFA